MLRAAVWLWLVLSAKLVTPAICKAANVALLHEAIRQSDGLALKQELDSGAPVNERDETGSTPLMTAILAGNLPFIKLLLARGADAHLRSASGEHTALLYAVEERRTDLVRILLENGVRPDETSSSGRTALQIAAEHGDAAMAALLLTRGAQVNAADNADNTALDYAADRGQREVVRLLLVQRADARRVHAKNGRGVLHAVAMKGRAELIPQLAEGGADPAAADRFDQTPLDLALAYGNGKAVAAFLNLRPKFPAIDQIAESAMETAVRRGRPVTALLLLENGWDGNRRTRDDSTYLNDAALRGQVKTARLLLDHGARLDGLNGDGGTPLHDAAIGGNSEMITLLLDRGAAINARERESGATPLMLAASLGREEAAVLLLKRGADPQARDNDGRTALMRARASQNTALVRLLEGARSPSSGAHTG